MIHISIDGYEINVESERTVLDAALGAGVYIPHLCFHPALGSSRLLGPRQRIYHGNTGIDGDSDDVFEGCNLCLAEVEGRDDLQQTCKTPVEDGMVIHTDSQRVKESRMQNLAGLLKKHPSVCITCDFAQGCDRKLCSMDTLEEERCCWKFHNCELREVAAFIGLKEGLHDKPDNYGLIDDNPLFSINYNLCINCLRCIIACRDIAGRNALGFVRNKKNLIVGTTDSTLKKSGCKFCLLCVDVCPTGALKEKDPTRNKSKVRVGLASSIFPPSEEKWVTLSKENLGQIPEKEGIYRLGGKDRNVIQITGSTNLRESLIEESENASALYFSYEENEMYMMRERQLIQQYMEKHGDLPPNNREIDELF